MIAFAASTRFGGAFGEVVGNHIPSTDSKELVGGIEMPLFCNGTHANGEITLDLGSWRLTGTQLLPCWSSRIAIPYGPPGSLSVSERRQKS